MYGHPSSSKSAVTTVEFLSPSTTTSWGSMACIACRLIEAAPAAAMWS
jgi:hypothetical protein